MTDWSAIDARFGRDTRPTDDPTRDDDSDQVVVAPDGGAGGWEAFDDPHPPEPEPQHATDDSTANPEARRIAGGHAFDKHVIQRGEYPEISTREEFADLIDEVMSNPTDSKSHEDGRTAYWHDDLGTVVVTNPHDPDGGTAFRPREGRQYFDEQG
jgi:filamentous hemagglutinin